MAEKDLANYRKNYSKSSLDESHLEASPFELFKIWFEEADNDSKIEEANAMSLSTVGKDMKPRTRVVLLKEFNTQGFVFFTNYNSHKGNELASQPMAAMNFFWPELERQIRVEGTIEMVSAKESDDYFYSRPRTSQAGAVVSAQSTMIPEDLDLSKKIDDLVAQPENIKRPSNWGGYRLTPDYFEFWQGRPSRIHDRAFYRLDENIWTKGRLSP